MSTTYGWPKPSMLPLESLSRIYMRESTWRPITVPSTTQQIDGRSADANTETSAALRIQAAQAWSPEADGGGHINDRNSGERMARQ